MTKQLCAGDCLSAILEILSADIWMLYNLAIDPGEEKNVAAQHPDVLQKMVAAYTKFVKDVGVGISRGWAYE